MKELGYIKENSKCADQLTDAFPADSLFMEIEETGALDRMFFQRQNNCLGINTSYYIGLGATGRGSGE